MLLFAKFLNKITLNKQKKMLMMILLYCACTSAIGTPYV